MDERSYLAIWQKYMPVIRLHIKRSLTEDQQFKLNITDFESAGDKGKSGYMFNINIEDGKVTNKISTSAVARDLYELLKADEVIRGLFKDKNVKISVGKSFILAIKTTHLSSYR